MLQGHVLGMYNLAMMHLAKDTGGCATALELLKKVAGAGRMPTAVLASCL